MSDEREDVGRPDGTDGASGEARSDGTDGASGEARPDGTDHAWTVLESNAEYETGWYTGGYDLVELPDGRTKKYYWAELPPAAVVVAVVDSAELRSAGSRTQSDDDEVLMVEQFRPTIRELCYELPAGIVEDGESFTTAGARELREETGFEPNSTALLEEFWCSTGVLRHKRGIVWAEGLEPATRKLDGNEFLAVRSVPVVEALELARDPPANDATIEGLLLAEDAGLL